MKAFNISKLSIVLLCLGGTMLLAPQSRAQADMAPDHFDGTDSWAAAASTQAPASKSHSATTTLLAQNNKPATPSIQPVAAHSAVATRRSTALATKRRKPAAKANN